MDFPRITVPTASPANLPPVVGGRVEAITGPSRYAVQIQGLLLELDLNLTLAVGDRLSLHVREQSANRLVLEVVPPGREPLPVPSATEELPEELREMAREFRRMRAPLDPELLDAARRSSTDAPTREAAAFLAAHGLEPTPERVEALARLAAPPLPLEARAELLKPLVEALRGLVSEGAGQVADRGPKLAGPPPALPPEALRALLESSPRLRMFDRLIEAVSSAPPGEADALRLVRGEPAIRHLPPLPRDAALTQLLGMERQEIEALPALAQAREGRGTAFEAAERMSSFRLINQLSLARDDGVMLLEIPIRENGALQVVPLRVRREGRGGGSGGDGAFRLTLDAEFSRLGPVRADLESSGKALKIRFRVRDQAVRAHLEGGKGDLVERLRALGFEPSVTGQVVGPEPKPSLFDLFAAPGEDHSVDFHA